MTASAPPRPRRAKAPTPAQRTAAMADIMIERVGIAGACERRDLLDNGFTEIEIDAFGDAARAQARARFVRQVGAAR